MSYFKSFLSVITILALPTGMWAQFGPPMGGAMGGGNSAVLGRITGSLVDSLTGKPIEFATVSLELSEFDKIVNGTTTNDLGKFEFDKIAKGNYRLTLGFLGYNDKRIDDIKISTTITEISLGKILLTPMSQVLDKVEIVGQRALIENKVDKIVYNADQDITSKGGQASDILKKVPMVTVDQDGNVQLRGSSNIQVLINGKPSQMMATSVADALRMIPADQIKTVEVITNPSAKYDAEGASGIINIITKKKNIDGINGTVGLSAGTRLNNGNASLNIKKGDLAILTSLGGNYFHPQKGLFENKRTSYYQNDTSILNQSGENTSRRIGFVGSFGLDYDINSHHNISSTIKGNRLRQGGEGVANVFLDNPGVLSDLNYQRKSENFPIFGGFDWTTDYKRTFSNPSQEFSAALQWNQGLNQNDFVIDQDGIFPLHEKSYNTGKNNEFTAQADYVQPFKDGTSLEFGGKSIWRRLTSDIEYTSLDSTTNSYIRDPLRSNIFKYNQDMYAAYSSYSFMVLKKINIKAGLRYERTAISSPDLENFDNHYDNLFPSLTISRTFKNYSTLKFGYNRRLQRPSQYYLNPFRNESDPLNITFGNPSLLPELTDNLEISYSGFYGGNFLNLSTFYRYSQDIIESFYTQVSSNLGETSFRNIGKNRSLGLSAFGSYQITNNWVLRGGGNVFTYDISTDIENISTTTYVMFNANIMTTLTLKNNWNIEGFGFFNAPRRTVQGKNPTFSYYEVGVKKEFWNKKASVKFGCTQPFTEYRRFITNLKGTNFEQYSEFKLPFRSFNLAFNYSFGKAIKPNKAKKINNDDLKQGDNNGGF